MKEIKKIIFGQIAPFCWPVLQLFHFQAILDFAGLHFPCSLEKISLSRLFRGLYFLYNFQLTQAVYTAAEAKTPLDKTVLKVRMAAA